jgi:tetratricopeptide (TPR) repeat protein/tRNA A-37 threonylcarbamoyl transferase component Bud32
MVDATSEPSVPADNEPTRNFGLGENDDGWMERLRMAESPGALGCIGSYELLSEAGRGGQGIVYRARQPGTKRDVAIKRMIAGSFATPAMRRRFEREVEIAARLMHPSIVTVFGIEVVEGHPLLAMEWIDGQPIDLWAEPVSGKRRSILETVTMMRKVCAAVAHAHQHGVIHRDLKPSNILIDREDAPHVLDFGLARPIGDQAEAESKITLTEQFVGTPAYAAPEQLQGGPSSADVRTDIYSLGVVLYQILTGQLPHNTAGPFSEVLNRIEHDAPERPSRVDPRVDRELETIVLKSLRKEPESRYQSANAMVEDLQRYARREPLAAHPPSTFYTVRKMVRRHWVAVSLCLSAVIVLVIFSATVSYQAARIRAQRDRVREEANKAQAINDFLVNMVTSPDPEMDGRDVRVVELLDRAALDLRESLAAEPSTAVGLHDALSHTYRGLGLYDEAAFHSERALQIAGEHYGPTADTTISMGRHHGSLLVELGRWADAEPLLIAARNSGTASVRELATYDLATSHHFQGHYEEAERLHRERLAILKERADTRPDSRWKQELSLALTLRESGRLVDAELILRRVLKEQKASIEDNDPLILGTLNDLGDLLTDDHQLDQAEPLIRQAYEGCRVVYGDSHSKTVKSLNNLAALLREQERYAEAEPMFREAYDTNLKMFTREHPRTIAALNNLGHILRLQERLPEAEPYYREAVELSRNVLGDEHPNTLAAMNNLAGLLNAQGKTRESADVFAELVIVGRQHLPEGHWLLGAFLSGHGVLLTKLKEFDDAEACLVEGYEIMRAAFGQAHPRTQKTCENVINLYDAWHAANPTACGPERIEPWKDKLNQ